MYLFEKGKERARVYVRTSRGAGQRERISKQTPDEQRTPPGGALISGLVRSGPELK